jgi:hypothetical protein
MSNLDSTLGLFWILAHNLEVCSPLQPRYIVIAVEESC